MPAEIDPAKARPHILALDLTRVIVVASVVGVHTLTVGAGKVSEPLGAVVTIFHSSREVFFLLTAFVLTYNYGDRKVHWIKFWRRRYTLILPAYVAWSFVYFLADGRRLDPASSAVISFGHALLTGDARYQLYFLLVTMQLYLAYPMLRWLVRKTAGHHLALFLASLGYELTFTLAIQQHEVTNGVIGGWLKNPDALLPSYSFYVVAGALGASHFERLATFTRRHMVVVGGLSLAGIGCAIGTYFAEIAIVGKTPAAASAVFQPAIVVESLTIAWALLAIGLCWAESGAPHRRLVAAGADSSFGIFLAHPLVLQGAVALAASTGVLAAIRGGPADLELAVLIGIGVPLIYCISDAIILLARRSPLSLILTGRQRERRTEWVHTLCALAFVPLMPLGYWMARWLSIPSTVARRRARGTLVRCIPSSFVVSPDDPQRSDLFQGDDDLASPTEQAPEGIVLDPDYPTRRRGSPPLTPSWTWRSSQRVHPRHEIHPLSDPNKALFEVIHSERSTDA